MLYCLLYHLIDIMTFGAIMCSLKDKKKGYKKERKNILKWARDWGKFMS